MSGGGDSLAWQYDRTRSFHQQSGCGNNWAAGFHTYAPQFCGQMLDLIRKELRHPLECQGCQLLQVEDCDHLGGFLLLQSMAGGTGAGLGAAICEAVRDEFPSSFLLNHSVWCVELYLWVANVPSPPDASGFYLIKRLLTVYRPYESGEVIVQSYNTVLSLSHAAENSDGLLLVENEILHRTCQSMLGIKSPSFQWLKYAAIHKFACCVASFGELAAFLIWEWIYTGSQCGGCQSSDVSSASRDAQDGRAEGLFICISQSRQKRGPVAWGPCRASQLPPGLPHHHQLHRPAGQ
eukprot:scaffold270804_cov42-Prasinocladus_malaysianus.AAC.1